MKKIICIVVLFLFPISNFAQKRHNIETSSGSFVFFDVVFYPKRIFSISGLTYSYKFKDKWEGFIGFNKSPYNFYDLSYDLFRDRQFPRGQSILLAQYLDQNGNKGKILERLDANMIDLGVRYKIWEKNAHVVKAALGLSANNVLNVVRSPFGTYYTMGEQPDQRREWYFGGLAGFRYDYTFWKERMNAGVYANARFYNDDFPFQINYGLQLGFSF